MKCSPLILGLAAALLVGIVPQSACGQLDSSGSPSKTCLPDLETLNAQREPPPIEPRTIDPQRFLPAPLTKKITLELVDQLLADALDEFGTQIGMPVVLDHVKLSDSGIPTDETVTIRMENEPAYFLLDRLSLLDLAWHVRNDIVYVTDSASADSVVMTTQIHLISDLVQSGFTRQKLHDMLTTFLGFEVGVSRKIPLPFSMSETILVTRCSDEVNRKIEALLAALRLHGQQTFVLEPAENIRIREMLHQPVDVEFVDTPLKEFVRELSELTGIPMQIDEQALNNSRRISLDQPINLTLKDKTVSSVLEVALDGLYLEAVPRHGTLLITTAGPTENMMLTAVFGVGDLCRNDCESEELIELIETQFNVPFRTQRGTIIAPRHDVLVIQTSNRALADVRQFLDDYRKALADNPAPEIDYNEIETRYYTVTAEQAADLLVTIPELIEPGTWKRVTDPEASQVATLAEDGIGSLLCVAMEPDVRWLEAPIIHQSDDENEDNEQQPTGGMLITQRATLIVRHTKLTQLKVAQLIQQVSDNNWDAKYFGEQPAGTGFFQIAPGQRPVGPPYGLDRGETP